MKMMRVQNVIFVWWSMVYASAVACDYNLNANYFSPAIAMCIAMALYSYDMFGLAFGFPFLYESLWTFFVLADAAAIRFCTRLTFRAQRPIEMEWWSAHSCTMYIVSFDKWICISLAKRLNGRPKEKEGDVATAAAAATTKIRWILCYIKCVRHRATNNIVSKPCGAQTTILSFGFDFFHSVCVVANLLFF